MLSLWQWKGLSLTVACGESVCTEEWGGWVGVTEIARVHERNKKKSPPASHACIKRHASACLGVTAGVRLPQLSEHFQATFSTVSLAAVLTFCPTPLPLTLFSEFPRLHLCLSSSVLPISPSDCVTRVKRKKKKTGISFYTIGPQRWWLTK